MEAGDGSVEPRLSRLVGLAARLSSLLTTEDVAAAVVDAGAQEVHADRVSVLLLDPETGRLDLVAAHGMSADIHQRFSSFPLSIPLPPAEAVRTGQVVVIRDAAERDRRFPPLAGSSASLSAVVVPLRLPDGPTFGALTVGFDREDVVDATSRQFVEGIAELCAIAIHRARLHDRERAAAARQAFLAEAGGLLVSSLDPEEVLGQIARLAVPTLADACAICIGEDGELRVRAVAHAEPDRQVVVERLAERAPVVTQPGLLEVWTGGEPVVAEQVDMAAALAAAEDPEHRSLLERLSVRAALAVPLRARGQAVGVLVALVTSADRRVTSEDVVLARELATRAALSIDNARLHADRLAMTENLERALQNRVVVEQAKGLLSSQLGVSPDEAFEPLRAAARRDRRSVYELADDLLTGRLDASALELIRPVGDAAG